MALKGGATMAWILRDDGGGEGDEVERGVGDVAEFVAVGVVDFVDGVECGDLGVGKQEDGGEGGEGAEDFGVDGGGAGAQDDDEGNVKARGGGADGVEELGGLGWRTNRQGV